MDFAEDQPQDAAKDEQPEGHWPAETEAHGATPPHGDPLGAEHAQTAGPHEHGDPEAEADSATGPHGDPLAG